MSVAENMATLPQLRGGNYEITRFNALQNGVLSQHTVLPWENGEEYSTLVEALVAEHKPQGPTEEHLVEELAGVIWRKRRLRLGENAVHHRALMRASEPHQQTAKAALIDFAEDVESKCIGDAIRATEEQTAEDVADLEEDQGMTEEALRILANPRPRPIPAPWSHCAMIGQLRWRRHLFGREYERDHHEKLRQNVAQGPHHIAYLERRSPSQLSGVSPFRSITIANLSFLRDILIHATTFECSARNLRPRGGKGPANRRSLCACGIQSASC
jgi:hypothetical protein